MDKLFTEFLIEKEYVAGLSKVTLKGYKVTWRTFKRIIKDPSISREVFFQFTKQMMDEGLQTKTINTHITVLNSFLTWAEYLVSYAMDTVLQIENLVGDLDKPFGIKMRFMDGRAI